MKGSQRAASEPASPVASRTPSEPTDWTRNWDADPIHAAAPRWTIDGKNALSHAKKHKLRETFIDRHARNRAWVPGPGLYKVNRFCETEEDGRQTRPDEPVTGTFGRSVRQTSLPNLKKIEKMGTTLLPSSFFTPGPGKYCAYTTFGSPSGPSRKRYYAANKFDNSGIVRPAAAFGRDSER